MTFKEVRSEQKEEAKILEDKKNSTRCGRQTLVDQSHEGSPLTLSHDREVPKIAILLYSPKERHLQFDLHR